MIDYRSLIESKKGLSFVIAVSSIFVLAVLAVIYRTDVNQAIESILIALGFHHGSQGAVDWRHASSQQNDPEPVQTAYKPNLIPPLSGDTSNQPFKPEGDPTYLPNCIEQLIPEQTSDLIRFKRNWQDNRARYEQVARHADVPAILVAALHQRESGCDFHTYLSNGDRLGFYTYADGRSNNGRQLSGSNPSVIRFTDWEQAAIDAITRETSAKQVSGVKYDTTNLFMLCAFAEHYNGMGYSKLGVPNPYILSGTSCYTKGKYTGDGHYDSNAIDKELGVLVMLRAIA